MSITSMGGLGAIGNMLSPYYSQITATQSTDTGADGCTDGSASGTTTSGSTASNALTGSSKAQISSEILALLVQMQMLAQSGSTAGATSSSTSASTIAATSGTSGTSTTATSSSTLMNPIASLFSAMDSNGDGTVSESEFENYLENIGGTQSEADSLYSQLTQGSSSGLTEAQLQQDLMGYGPPPPPSAGQMADGLVQAMGGSDGSVTKSEFENFVTSNGGTTAQADADFAALDTSGSATLSAGDIEQAIEKQQSAQSSTAATTASTSSTSISPLLAMLDSLAATAGGTTTV